MEKERLLSFIRNALETCREETGFTGRQHVFLVDIYVKGGSPSSKIEVLVDTDSGISIAECLSVNRCLSSAVDANDEVKGLVGDDYELTVSSPGIGAPIKHLGIFCACSIPMATGRCRKFPEDFSRRRCSMFPIRLSFLSRLRQEKAERGGVLNRYGWGSAASTGL